MKKHLLTVFLLLLGSTLFAQSQWVFAQSGLNMRASSDSKSKVLATVPYGAEVKLLADGGNDMVIENLKGGMAKVSWNGKTGYMFSGFLAPYPAPKKGSNVEKYVDQLRMSGQFTAYETHHYDYDGAGAHEEVFYLKGTDYQKAWLVVKALFNVSKNIKYPNSSSRSENETIELKPVEEYIFGEGFQIKRDRSGNMTELSYFKEGEGTSMSYTIEVEDNEFEGKRLKITESGGYH